MLQPMTHYRLLFPSLRRWCALLGALNLATALLLPSFAAAAGQPGVAAAKPKCKKGYVLKQTTKKVKVKKGKKKVWVKKKVWTCAKDTVKPTAPGSLTAAAGDAAVALTWTASKDNAGITGYRISRDGTVVSTVTATSFNDSGLTNGTTYSYSVVALDAAGNVSPAATASATPQSSAPPPPPPPPPDTTAPSAPAWSTSTTPGQEGIYGDITAHAMRLNWQASSDNGGSGVATYRIYRFQSGMCLNDEAVPCVAPASLASYTKVKEISASEPLTWLDCGTKTECGTLAEPHGDLPYYYKYHYYMTAVDAVGNVSEPSPEVSSYVSAPPL